MFISHQIALCDNPCNSLLDITDLTHTLQARYDIRTNPEPILSVQGRTNPERILNHDRTVAEPILLIRSATV